MMILIQRLSDFKFMTFASLQSLFATNVPVGFRGNINDNLAENQFVIKK